MGQQIHMSVQSAVLRGLFYLDFPVYVYVCYPESYLPCENDLKCMTWHWAAIIQHTAFSLDGNDLKVDIYVSHWLLFILATVHLIVHAVVWSANHIATQRLGNVVVLCLSSIDSDSCSCVTGLHILFLTCFSAHHIYTRCLFESQSTRMIFAPFCIL